MEKYNRIEKEWLAVLEGNNPDHIITTLYEIRNSGSVTMVPVLFTLIHQKSQADVRSEVLKLLGEIKSQDAVPLIAESLEKHDYGEFLPALVAACWQTGLDFSKYLRVFAGLFIQADYRTAVEAFTVIEESIPHASDHEIMECLRFLRDAECMITDEKLNLYKELRKVVENS